MAAFSPLKQLLKDEIKQMAEAGYDVSGFTVPETDDTAALNEAYDALLKSPKRADFPYTEPESLDAIRADSECVASAAIPEEKLLRHLHAAWVGRAAGCALGKPVECGEYMHGTPGTFGWRNVKRWFEGADAYPIADYTPGRSRAEAEGLMTRCPLSMKENITFMESDDDVRYTVLGLRLLEEKGYGFTEWDIGELWRNNLPYGMVYTAEKQAYLNYALVCDVPGGGSAEDAQARLSFVRNYRNPYREWIGAQIRVDGYAYAAAGDPMLASALAYTDAHFSHIGNGVYGAMFCAAMIAAAFTASSPREIVETGLKVVPKGSRLYAAITDTLATVQPGMDPEVVCEMLWQKYGNYNGVHTINNAAAVAAALLLADGDYEKAITTAVLCGWDTDCNGATVGSIMGAFLGEVPEKWAAPLHDTMYSSVAGFDPITFTDGAARTLALIRAHRPEAIL